MLPWKGKIHVVWIGLDWIGQVEGQNEFKFMTRQAKERSDCTGIYIYLFY